MNTLLLILIVIAVGFTLYTLVRGVIGMAQQKDLTGQRSQELMRKRVLYQGVAILLAILLLLMMRGGN
jgi:hypothetical protein